MPLSTLIYTNCCGKATLSVRPPARPSICPPICPSIYESNTPSIRLSISCLSIQPWSDNHLPANPHIPRSLQSSCHTRLVYIYSIKILQGTTNSPHASIRTLNAPTHPPAHSIADRSICPSTNLSMHRSIHPIHPSVNQSVHALNHQFIHLSTHPSIHLSILPSLHPSIDPSICPSIDPSIHSSINPSINPFNSLTHPPTHQPIHQPTNQPISPCIHPCIH